VVQEILKYVGQSPDVWFARHEELANWALTGGVDEHSYRSRYFDGAASPAPVRARG
jgi:allantoinase